MRTETTRKNIANWYYCKSVPYGNLQNLLGQHYNGVSYYTAGIYGWNFDAFCYGDKCITTGYRNLVGDRVDRKIVDKYEEKARAVWENREIPWDKKAKKIDKLVEKFFTEAFKEV